LISYLFIYNYSLSEAYQVACLGVTNRDWELFAFAALEGNQLDLARRAFIRIKEYKYLNLLSQCQVNLTNHILSRLIFHTSLIRKKKLYCEIKYSKDLKRQSGAKLEVLLGYVYAYQSKFNEAAKSFRRAGEEQLAINLFTDLRMFEQAKEYLVGGGGGGVTGVGASVSGSEAEKNSLLVKQAEWAMRTGDAKSAAEFYMSSKQYGKAIELAGKNKWPEMLLEIARKLDKADREALAKCAAYFKEMQMNHFAAEVYEKMGNIKELVELRMQANQWEEVFVLANKYPELSQMAHYNYGQWLAENDMFEQAQKGK
jgi:intraflagellar transport protein 122